MNVKWPKLALEWKGALKKYRSALLVLAIGVLLLALPGSGGGESRASPETAAQEAGFDLKEFEEKLGRALSGIDGAGETRVVLTLDSGSRQVLAQDLDRDGAGGGGSTTVTLGRGGGSQEVVPLQTLAPSFRGALVVCPGGGDPAVRLKLVEAVSALTGLGADRVSICAGNS